jgi:hypothetical protein
MRSSGPAAAKLRPRVVASFLALFAASAILASCASSGGGGSGALGTFWKGGSKDETPDISSDYFTQSTYCPRVEVRAGTEAMAFYEKGHDGDAAFVKYQASLGKTARECHNSGPNYTLKIGISGRVVAGPKGAAGTVTVPVRVAIAQQLGGVAYSELFKIPVDVAAPTFSSDFAHVIDQIALQIPPDQHNFIIYVGFDEGKVAKPVPKNVPTG